MKTSRQRGPAKNKELLLAALERSLGIVTPACKEVGVSRNTFYEYYKKDPVFKAAVDDINEITLDFVENSLLKAIKDGNVPGILFYMKYKARKRGYTDQVDITSNGNTIGTTIINIINPLDQNEQKKLGDGTDENV